MILGPALDSDAREAFLFESANGRWRAVALDREGSALPKDGGQKWRLLSRFDLGVYEAVPDNIDPEPILSGIRARGFYLWRVERMRPTQETDMLKRFELKKDGDGWALFDQLGDRVRAFRNKAEALGGGTLERLVGTGTVRIHREDGQFEEERTFPRSEDPRRSQG
jgi:hypothetical protein